MDEVRALGQSALQTPQVGQIQDQQQRQTTVDQRAGVLNFSQRVEDRQHQVTGSSQVESDPLAADGHSDGGRDGTPEEEPGPAGEAAVPKDPDLGQTIDVRA